MKNKLILVVTGPSGVGKSTILKALPKENFYFSVSHTTRDPRPGEVNGKDYYFVSEDEFKRMIENGEFLEWVKVFDTYYGTAKSEIDKAFSQGKHLVLDIEVIGASRLKGIFGREAVFIFIAPPSFEELERRLKLRGTESEEKLKKRLSRAKEELKFASWFDYVIINDDLEESINSFFSIVKSESLRPWRQEKWNKIFAQLT